jgi:hypothetical protein
MNVMYIEKENGDAARPPTGYRSHGPLARFAYRLCMAVDEALTTVADPAVTLPVAAQPTESPENAMVAPRQTVVVVERSLGPADRCGAKLKGRPGEFCADVPVEGRSRCRVHGGLTPVGRQSPQFVHGRDSKYAVPLTEDEQIRFEQYKSAVFDQRRDDLAADLALARIQRDRAMTAGSSSVPESDAVARLAATHARITAGKTIRVVPDEATARALFGAIYGCIREAANETLGPPGTAYSGGAKPLLALVAKKVVALDWSKVNIEVREPIRLGDAGLSSGTMPADS